MKGCLGIRKGIKSWYKTLKKVKILKKVKDLNQKSGN